MLVVCDGMTASKGPDRCGFALAILLDLDFCLVVSVPACPSDGFGDIGRAEAADAYASTADFDGGQEFRPDGLDKT